MHTVRFLIVATSLALLGGCGPTVVVDGFKLDQARYEEQRNSLLKRAAFDLKCPEGQIKITILATYGENGLKQAGVSGCSQQATYVSLDAKSWVLNATTDSAATDQQAPH